MSYPELEIFLYRRGESEFAAVLRLRDPEEDAAEQRFEAEPIRFDFKQFESGLLLADPARYGLELGQALFALPAVRDAFTRATAAASKTKSGSLRVRLCTDQRSLKLHRLRWETLRRPDPNAPDDTGRADRLMDDQKVLFSRHLFSGDMRPVRLRPQSDLTALIAVSSPTDVSQYQAGGRPLPAVNVEEELRTAEQGLQSLKKDLLVPPAGRVTLARLLEALRKEPDVLYLVCHGAIVDGEPRLLLEKDDGTAQVVSGNDLVNAFKGLRSLPRLVVLISCQSAGDGAGTGLADTAVLSAIGPRLAEAGVAAVLAMQGNLQMSTARRFLPPFFEVLRRTGQVDEAVTKGRAAVRDEPDAWVPVLFTRLVEGRVWYTGEIAVAGEKFDAWEALAVQLNRGYCVPILGSGLLDPFLGSTREVANRMAEASGYPLALSGREDLPQVAQFLKTMKGELVTRDELIRMMMESVCRRWPELHLEPDSDLPPEKALRELLVTAWKAYQQDRPYEPHRYLAGLRKIKAIITTNPDDLLEEALEAAGRHAQVHLCRWDAGADTPDSGPAPDAGSLEATPDRPHVYQLFGHLSDPDSLVVTEDDYFRLLTAFTRSQGQKKNEQRGDDLTDTLLRGTLASSALIFLGFRITDWDFRTLFRLLMDQNGRQGRRKFTHIAVQIDPEDGTHGEVVRVRDFIERLFFEMLGTSQSGKVAVYWGGTEDFLKELDRKWKATQPSQPSPTPRPPQTEAVRV